MAYMYEEELAMGMLAWLASAIPSVLLGIASYVLSSMAVYTIARRRGLRKPWLAWIPVANVWLLGSLSDQYHYVVKGENKSKRKWLLILNVLVFAFTAAIAVLAIGTVSTALLGSYRSESELLRRIWGPVMAILGLCLPLVGAAIACAIIRYMALYDVFKSLDPNNCVMFLVLSILFGVTEPFFLFFNRNKDLGMPPRRQEYEMPPQEEYTWQPPQAAEEPWENPEEF